MRLTSFDIEVQLIAGERPPVLALRNQRDRARVDDIGPQPAAAVRANRNHLNRRSPMPVACGLMAPSRS
jgi:hypothetical protein